MDPITHTMAGAVMARAGGDRRTPLAATTLMLAANAPDIDIVSVWAGSSASIAFRRGWTHGPIALVVLAFVVTGAVLAWDRWWRRRRRPEAAPVDPRWTLALASLGVISHPALDWLNTYGIRLLMPFSERWFYGDAVFIIDPYWWAMLAATLVLARKSAPPYVVRAAAAVTFAYPLVLLGVSRLGVAAARPVAPDEGTGQLLEVLYQPRPANPLAAQLVAVTPEGYRFGALRWTPTASVSFDGPFIARGPWDDPRVQQARQEPAVANYLVWSRYPWVRVDPDGQSVTFGDARFPGVGSAGGLGGLRVSLR